jgi:hypothetical protein
LLKILITTRTWQFSRSREGISALLSVTMTTITVLLLLVAAASTIAFSPPETHGRPAIGNEYEIFNYGYFSVIFMFIMCCVQISQYSYNYYNSGQYQSSWPLFKTRRFGNWILSPSSGYSCSGGPNRYS